MGGRKEIEAAKWAEFSVSSDMEVFLLLIMIPRDPRGVFLAAFPWFNLSQPKQRTNMMALTQLSGEALQSLLAFRARINGSYFKNKECSDFGSLSVFGVCIVRID